MFHHRVQKDKVTKDHRWVQKDKDAKIHRRVGQRIFLKLLEGMENEPILQQFSGTYLEWISVAIPLKG